ncbi:Phosphoglycerate Kinase 2 [Manis pentadactyla]|nr:Phosphoglycerate Kinase 2 [Manis pentadactyla]
MPGCPARGNIRELGAALQERGMGWNPALRRLPAEGGVVQAFRTSALSLQPGLTAGGRRHHPATAQERLNYVIAENSAAHHVTYLPGQFWTRKAGTPPFSGRKIHESGQDRNLGHCPG